MKNNNRNLIVVFLVLFFTLSIIPSVLGKTRNDYLVEFIYHNEINGKGFRNSIDGAKAMSPESTAYALEILNEYGNNAHDISDLQSNLEDDIKDMFNSDNVIIYDLYFLLKSLDILDYSIDRILKNRVYQYLNDTEQIDGGFSFSNTSTSASLTSTYFVYQIYSVITNAKPLQNATLHKNWILSCNNSDGGYGGNSSLSSTLLNTYYAVFLLNILGTINDLADKDQTLFYLNSYYVNETADVNNVGGYLPDLGARYALLSSTYYCVVAISILDDNMLNKSHTPKWVLSRQYFQDGGFADITEGDDQLSSSVIASYYAFETLNPLDALGALSVEIWMVEFNYTILAIILGSIGLIVVAGVFIWRRRRI